MAKSKAYFGAVPFRAFPDRRLTDLDIRALGVIAAHDSMSLIRNGAGCWAGTDRLAELINANANNISSAITRLERFGYLRRGPHPHDGRKSTLRVIYDAKTDKAAFKGNVSPNAETTPDGLSPGTIKVPRPDLPATPANQPKPDRNIPYQNIPLNIPSAESAPRSVGAELAKREREFKAGEVLDLEPTNRPGPVPFARSDASWRTTHGCGAWSRVN